MRKLRVLLLCHPDAIPPDAKNRSAQKSARPVEQPVATAAAASQPQSAESPNSDSSPASDASSGPLRGFDELKQAWQNRPR